MLGLLTDVEAAPLIPARLGNYTIVNLLPYALIEDKASMIPGHFQVPAAKGEEFGLLHIGESIHWQHTPLESMPAIKHTTSPFEMARAIVSDFIDGQIAVDTNIGPGVFFLEGHLTREDVKKKHAAELAKYKERQRVWFVTLVKIANDDWAKTKQNKAISDIQRAAARWLGMMNLEWMQLDGSDVTQVKNCSFCRSIINPAAVICPICKEIVDKAAYDAMKGNK